MRRSDVILISVQPYLSQFQGYYCHVNFYEDNVLLILRFARGLCDEIKERIPLQFVIDRDFWDVAKITLQVEMKIQRESSQAMKKLS